MKYKEARARAEEIDKTLRADEHFNHVIYVDHLDGTKMELWYADFRKEDEWIMIFTEHNGIFVYHEEDLEDYSCVLMEEADKTIRIHEIKLNLDKDVIDGLCQLGLEAIKNDKKALVDYAANKALERIVETDGECLRNLKEE